MQTIGLLFARIVISLFIGFFIIFILSIVYYRFKWLDPKEEDRPEFDALEFGVSAQITIHIISEKLLLSRRFYLLGGIVSVLIFLISYA